MTTETTESRPWRERIIYKGRGASEAVYGLGLLGAWYYYITTAPDFTAGALGILKGIVWPAMLVYEALRAFGL